MNNVKYFNLYGSTGQIGSKSLQIIDRYFPSIKINLLVANTNYKKLLKQAIEINPNYAEAHNNLGNVFQALNNEESDFFCLRRCKIYCNVIITRFPARRDGRPLDLPSDRLPNARPQGGLDRNG